jgi:predicted CoA-binding protein
MPPSQTVVILGASNKPERYAYQAFRLLQQYGHRVILVHPTLKKIEGVPVCASVRDIKEKIDTLTLYVGTERLTPLIDDIVALKPGRVIFNPGTESLDLMSQLGKNRIPYEAGCTLVLLRSGQF